MSQFGCERYTIRFHLQVSVQNFDGTPIRSEFNQIRVLESSSFYEDENTTESIRQLDSSGMLHFSLVVRHSNGFTLKFVYMDAEERLGWISAAQSKAHTFIRAELRTQK